MRPARILAIARRDLRSEFAGRRFGLLGIIALLLAPAIAIEVPEEARYRVRGDVPEEVLALPHVKTVKRAGQLSFYDDHGTLRVFGFFMDPQVRAVLDQGQPAIEVEVVQPPPRWPKRSLFFALIAASTLTGSVSTSIGGERTRRTLQALLSAAVSKLEIVLGKWLAWGGFGSVVSLTAAAGAVFWGKQALGPWILALPMVPLLTVALGLWLVRRTDDVIAGTSVSLRVLPAVLGGTGLLALLLGTRSDVAAAALPLGGVMLAAGDLWDGSWPLTLLAVASSGLTTAGLLWMTARDLEEEGAARRGSLAWLSTLRDGLGSAVTWWTLTMGPVLWGWAGNAAATEQLKVESGLWAGAALLAVLSAIAWARHNVSLGGLRVTWRVVPAVFAVVIAGLMPHPVFENPWLTECARRMAFGAAPPLVFLPVLLAQELWFRGFLQRAGWWLGALLWTLAVAPLNPVAGLIGGVGLAWCAQDGLGNAVVARLLGAAVLYASMTTTP